MLSSHFTKWKPSENMLSELQRWLESNILMMKDPSCDKKHPFSRVSLKFRNVEALIWAGSGVIVVIKRYPLALPILP